MKTPRLLKSLVAAAAAIAMTLTAQAAKTAKVVVEDEGKTLRFVYDEADYGEEGSDWYSVPESRDDPGWLDCHEDVTKVVFDASFNAYQPTSCYEWFYNFYYLTRIEGIENLDTSCVTDMMYMFASCTSLRSLDLSTFDTANVTDMHAMFGRCTSLETIYASDKFVTDNVADGYYTFYRCDRLVGGGGSVVGYGRDDAAYARIGGLGKPGYFTDKTDDSVVRESVGKYLSLDLEDDLGVVIDANYSAGDKVTVKIEGLAKGLKLVTTTVISDYVYTITGTPTETVDCGATPMYARVTTTYKDKTKGKVETLQPLPLAIAPAKVRAITDGVLAEAYGPVDIPEIWPEVSDAPDHAKEWSFKGWPSGITYKNGMVMGKPTKAGEFTVTATHKYKLSDGKTTVSETETAVFTVWGSSAKRWYYQQSDAYYSISDITLDAAVKSVGGLPTGIKFDSKTKTISGKPTKTGTFAVTFTKTDNSKETVLWKVTPGYNCGALSGVDWEDSAPVQCVNATVRLMQGFGYEWYIDTYSDSKITASGLPTGLKLVYDKNSGDWVLEGVPTKTGNFVATFKTVREGVTVTERVAFEVQANEYAGTYYLIQDRNYQGASVSATLSIAAGGTAKLILTENTRKTTVTDKKLHYYSGSPYVYFTLPADEKAGIKERDCYSYLDDGKLWVYDEESDDWLLFGQFYEPIVPTSADDIVTTRAYTYRNSS